MGLETTSTSLTTNKNTSNKVGMSINKMNRQTILAMVTITHKHRMNILDQQMNIIKIMPMIAKMTTTTTTKV